MGQNTRQGVEIGPFLYLWLESKRFDFFLTWNENKKVRNTECFLLFIIQIKFSSKNNRTFINYSKIRGVVPEVAGGAFGRSVNPISTRGGRLCLPNNTDTSGFSDLPTTLVWFEGSIAFKSTLSLYLSALDFCNSQVWNNQFDKVDIFPQFALDFFACACERLKIKFIKLNNSNWRITNIECR